MKKEYISRALASRSTWHLCHNKKTFEALSNATKENIDKVIDNLIGEGEFVSLSQVANAVHQLDFKLDLTVNELDYHEERYIDNPNRIEYYYFTDCRGEVVYGCSDRIVSFWRDYQVSHSYMVTRALYWQDEETLLVHVERITDVVKKILEEENTDADYSYVEYYEE